MVLKRPPDDAFDLYSPLKNPMAAYLRPSNFMRALKPALLIVSIFVAAFPDRCIIPLVCCISLADILSICIQSYIVAFIVHIRTYICHHCCSTEAACMCSVTRSGLSPVFLMWWWLQSLRAPVPLGEIFFHIQMLKAYPYLFLPARAPFITLML